MQKGKLTAVGSVIAAIAASTCCVGPLVAMLLGTGSLAAASGLREWRTLFLGVTFMLLVLAWYLTYRMPKAEGCADGTACPVKTGGKATHVLLWVATTFAIALVGLPLYSGAVARLVYSRRAGPARIAGGNVAILKVKIPGMDCEACSARIERIVSKAKGVARAKVTFETKEAVVEYDAKTVSPEKIIAAIDETGFEAEPTKRKER